MTSLVSETSAGLTVSALARAAGISPDAVRFYEKEGLLLAPPRSSAGYRRYRPDAVDRLQFIRGAQRLGLHLREIRDLLAVRDTGVCPCEPAEEMLRRHLTEIDAQIARLISLRRDLQAMVESIPGPDCPDPVPGTWRPAADRTEP
jgi:DNA-binding transcriptional MerR regulator